jgi:hypothetical protein
MTFLGGCDMTLYLFGFVSVFVLDRLICCFFMRPHTNIKTLRLGRFDRPYLDEQGEI